MTSTDVVDADREPGEVPCDQCGKSFADSYALKMHLCRGGGNGLVVQNLPINIPMARDFDVEVQKPDVYAPVNRPKKRVRQLPDDDEDRHVNDEIPDPNEVDRNKVRRNGYGEEKASVNSSKIPQSNCFSQFAQISSGDLAAVQAEITRRMITLDECHVLLNTEKANITKIETEYSELTTLEKSISDFKKRNGLIVPEQIK